MQSLINMQSSAEEAKEYVQPSAEDAPKYPWGLCVTLDDDSLEKLGVSSLPAVGTEVTIMAKAIVTAARENATQGGESEASVDLQITDMRVDGMDAGGAEAEAARFYRKMKA